LQGEKEISIAECKQLLAVWLLSVSNLCAHVIERVAFLVMSIVFGVVVNYAP